jgi:hypothetical protein
MKPNNELDRLNRRAARWAMVALIVFMLVTAALSVLFFAMAGVFNS